MFGQYTGTLEAFYKRAGVETRLFGLSGGQGPSWQTTIQHLPLNTDLQVYFTA